MGNAQSDKGLDYASLFEDGIGRIQALASDHWTDYNQHDPGITILQQLCYALTDLTYRTGWPDVDLLVPPGSEELPTTFFKGPDILTCAPVTWRDHRSFLYAEIMNVENAWLRASDDARKLEGLYDIDVQPYESDDNAQQTENLRYDVLSTYMATRPLCEDVAYINGLAPFKVTIAADIGIDDRQAPDDVAAKIFFSLQESLITAPSYASIQAERDAGKSYDEIFEGPALDVIIDNDTPDKRPLHLPIASFLKITRSTDGVENLRRFRVEGAGGPQTTTVLEWSKNFFPTVDVVDTLAQHDGAKASFALYCGKVLQTLNVDRVQNSIEHLKYMDHEGVLSTMRAIRDDSYNALPRGAARALDVFTSIREQFPMVYGLGPQGIPRMLVAIGFDPEGLTNAKAARVNQLKAYLLIFEQIMANHLAQLANVPLLFSLSDTEQTYFVQAIQSGAATGTLSIDDVLAPDKAQLVAELAKNPGLDTQRRERLLNHLLARFNESFDDSQWNRVWETGSQTAADVEAVIKRRNAAKAAFLTDYVTMSASRGGGIDYSRTRGDGEKTSKSQAAEPSSRTVSGLEQRIKALTGVSELTIVEHILLRNRADQEDTALVDFYSLKLSVIIPQDVIETHRTALSFVKNAIGDNCPPHIESVILVLGGDLMQQFGALYSNWRAAYARAFSAVGRGSQGLLPELDRHSLTLRNFLIDAAQESVISA